jgi:NADH-quinone oxidoreductase subunit B
MLEVNSQEILDGKFERILNFFRSNSLWMLYYCTGCGAVELPPVMTSRYDCERFGFGPMATPRQADILLVTGYVSVKTLKRIVRSYEQMPEPKYVIGFGSCPVNGGIYWKSYATVNHLDRYIPVDLNITGCMPRPQAVIDGFLTLVDMIKKGEAVGYKKYKLNYEWYKRNQEEVLARTEPVFGAATAPSPGTPAPAKPAVKAAAAAAAGKAAEAAAVSSASEASGKKRKTSARKGEK